MIIASKCIRYTNIRTTKRKEKKKKRGQKEGEIDQLIITGNLRDKSQGVAEKFQREDIGQKLRYYYTVNLFYSF